MGCCESSNEYVIHKENIELKKLRKERIYLYGIIRKAAGTEKINGMTAQMAARRIDKIDARIYRLTGSY